MVLVGLCVVKRGIGLGPQYDLENIESSGLWSNPKLGMRWISIRYMLVGNRACQ